MAFRITHDVMTAMRRHAEETYPEECCGVLLAFGCDRLHARRCRNIQNTLHEQDPEAHPRDARTAYTIDPAELLDITRELDRRNGTIRAFYHSHPDHASYFSAEDRKRAVVAEWGEPLYPDAAHLVLSVQRRKTTDVKVFAWDASAGEFTERELEVIE